MVLAGWRSLPLKSFLPVCSLTLFLVSAWLAAGALTVKAEYDPRLAVWVRLGDLENGLASLEPHVDKISRVLVSDHCIHRQGQLLDYRISGGEAKACMAVAWCRSRNLPVLMGLGNYGGGFSHSKIIVRMLSSSNRRARHIRYIRRAVRDLDYDGVDLDYENLPAASRYTFTVFVRELGTALAADGKQLDVTVPPKFSSPGWPNTRAYDWQALPGLVTHFNVMCYDWFIRSGPPGPIIPLGVTEKVIAFAEQCPHPERFWIGHPAYGNDWVRGRGRSWRGRYAGSRDLQVRASEHQATIRHQSPAVGGFRTGPFAHYEYQADDGRHYVWYGDQHSLAATQALLRNSQMGGIFIWRAGFEDPGIWQEITPAPADKNAAASSSTGGASHPASGP